MLIVFRFEKFSSLFCLSNILLSKNNNIDIVSPKWFTSYKLSFTILQLITCLA